SPTDTSATSLATELEQALAQHSLEGIALAHDDARSAFEAHIEPLREFPLEVSVGEIDYDLREATLPLHWSWEILGNTWEYETLLEATYEDSQWVAHWQPDTLIPDLQPGSQIGLDRVSPPRGKIRAHDQ